MSFPLHEQVESLWRSPEQFCHTSSGRIRNGPFRSTRGGAWSPTSLSRLDGERRDSCSEESWELCHPASSPRRCPISCRQAHMHIRNPTTHTLSPLRNQMLSLQVAAIVWPSARRSGGTSASYVMRHRVNKTGNTVPLCLCVWNSRGNCNNTLEH